MLTHNDKSPWRDTYGASDMDTTHDHPPSYRSTHNPSQSFNGSLSSLPSKEYHNYTSTTQWSSGFSNQPSQYPFNLPEYDTINLKIQETDPDTYLILPSNADHFSPLYTAKYSNSGSQLSLHNHPGQTLSSKTAKPVGSASHIHYHVRAHIDYTCHGQTYNPTPKLYKTQKWAEPYGIVPEVHNKRTTRWQFPPRKTGYYLRLELVHEKDPKVKIMEVEMKDSKAGTITIPKQRVQSQEALDLLVLTAMATASRYFWQARESASLNRRNDGYIAGAVGGSPFVFAPVSGYSGAVCGGGAVGGGAAGCGGGGGGGCGGGGGGC